MTRSPFTVFSALVVACSKASGGCGAAIGKRCTAKTGYEMAHCHTSRRKAADEQRTREVQGQAIALMRKAAHHGLVSDIIEEPPERISGALKRPYMMMNSMDPRPKPLPLGVKSLFDPTRKLECNAELFDDETPPKPFFTPSPGPIPPEYYHNVAGRDGIFTIAMKSEAFSQGAQVMKDELGGLLKTMNPPSNLSLLPDDLDPPNFLPMREPLPPRVPDLNPDTQWTGDELAAHDAEKAIDEANWLAQSDAEIATGIVSVDDGTDLEF